MWVKLERDSDIEFLIKPLSHAALATINNSYYINNQDPTFYNPKTFRDILISAVIETKGVYNFPEPKDVIHQLWNEDIVFLHQKLLDISNIVPQQVDAISDMLDIQFNPQFKDPSWDCSICQERGLDYTRACGYLDKDKRDPAPMLPAINGKRAEVCPISTLDTYVLSQASLAHSLFVVGVMPEVGGLGNQSEWFIKASLLYKRKLIEAENAAMEASRRN